jgi:integrase
MSVFKRGKVWWYNFWWEGQHIQKSSYQSSKRTAEQMESAERTRLAKREVGLVDKKPVPTFKEFSKRFRENIQSRCESKPETIRFYMEKLARLLEYPPLANAMLDQIDEELVEAYVQRRRKMKARNGDRLVTPGSINRELSTLRLILGLAHEWKLIGRIPKIRKLQGEKQREFVLSHEQELIYLENAPMTLKDAALLMIDGGFRLGEVAALRWKDIHLESRNGSKQGFIRIEKGKSLNAKRNITITQRVKDMLLSRISSATSEWVFPGSNQEDHILVTSLDHLHSKLRDKLGLPQDFVLHSLRHTMLTRLGEAGVDAFTLQKIAGHSSIEVTKRYIHPSPELMEKAFERMEDMNAKRFEATTITTTGKNGSQSESS